MLRLIPNILTLGRLVLTVVFLVMILYSPYAAHASILLDIAFVLFVVAGLTDIIDGIVARGLNVVSKFGRMVDPLVDKVLVCGTFVCFAVVGEPKLFDLGPVALGVIQWPVAGVLIVREAYVTVLRHVSEARGISFAATASGKVKMLTQSFAIGTVIIKMGHVQTATWGYWFTAVTYAVMLAATVVSGLMATRRLAGKNSTEGRGT
ncbi:MAG: CDP-alcohol phosphatidyltransferase family protein [Phycisphaerales bacterium]|nr:MAG: CDP-alcohol phosphatidyltransferase family protein [Phycisphaerales bacterium]